jgi:hypothetical protein
MFFLTIEDGNVVVKMKGKTLETFKTLDDYKAFFTKVCEENDLRPEDLVVMSSSSLDFPEEETEDPAVIELCNQIRS